jgi:hypothetical protein
MVPKNLDEMSILKKREARRHVGWIMSGPRQQLKCRRFESETPRLFRVQGEREAVHTKNVVAHSVLRRAGVREALKNMNEGAMLRNTKSETASSAISLSSSAWHLRIYVAVAKA